MNTWTVFFHRGRLTHPNWVSLNCVHQCSAAAEESGILATPHIHLLHQTDKFRGNRELMNSNISLEQTKESSPRPQNRKVRKGTQSCWECKRRKTRCIKLLNDPFCVGCKSRDTPCLSQETHEEASAARPMAKRKPHRRRMTSQATQVVETTLPQGKHEDVCRALAELWPCQHDLDVLYSVTAKDPDILRSPLCSSHSNSSFQNDLSPQDILQTSPHESHPVALARKLLWLSFLVQQLSSQALNEAPSLHGMVNRILDKVVSLVTTNDELAQSVEGMECVILESMIHNNNGNLRRALLSLRRAMTLAQLMGLHRKNPASSVFNEPETQTRIDFDHIWLRLVESDRYLALMLGVPQLWTDNSFLERKQLELCSPMEKLERLLLIAGGRVLDRNEKDMQNLAVTQEIDQLLQCASTCMPPQWWLYPNFSSEEEVNPKRKSQLMLQFTYFFLLTQLHFPYLLYPSDNHFYIYSKITAVNSSREVLNRFTAFRSNDKTIFYCRGVDLIAFIASVVLCLAHIAGHRGQKTYSDDSEGCKAFYYLTHQRVSDRGLVERMLEHMEQTSYHRDDAIASELVNLLKPLLAMETCSSTGAILSVNFETQNHCELSHSSHVDIGGKALCIAIPHCGKVNLVNCAFDTELLPSIDSLFNLGMDIDSTWIPEETLDEDVPEFREIEKYIDTVRL